MTACATMTRRSNPGKHVGFVVVPHTEATGPTGQGFVVRDAYRTDDGEIWVHAPYGLQAPDIRVYKREHAAKRAADKLNEQPGAFAENPGPVVLSRRAYEIEYYTLSGGKKREIPFAEGVKVTLHSNASGDRWVELTTPKWYGPILPRDIKPGLVSEDLLRLAYWHEEDGHDYNHDFDPGTIVFLTGDNSVLIGRPDLLPSWKKF